MAGLQKRIIAVLLVLCSASPGARADTPAEARLETVAEGVLLLRGSFDPGRQPDGNSVLLQGPAGLVVIDSGRHAAHAGRLIAAASQLDLPIVALVNTHWHLDHVSGNPRLRAAYPALQVHATEAIDGALDGFLARSRSQLEAQMQQAGDEAQRQALRDEIERIDAGAALRPDVVLAASSGRTLAGRALQLHRVEHAVTAADLWVFDPATRVLIAGDLVTLPAPFLDTACPDRWQATLAQLEDTGFDRLVPGHGAVMSREDFRTYRAAFDGLLACAAGDATPDQCVQGWLASAAPLLEGHPEALTQGLITYYVQQRLRGAARDADCPAPEDA